MLNFREYTKALMYLDFKDKESVRLLRSATMEGLLKSRQEANKLKKIIQVVIKCHISIG